MALRGTTVWEVQTGGSDTNGGGFDSSETTGTDRSQATSAHVTFDGSTVKWTIAAAGLTIKIYGHTVETADLGNVLNVTGGTNATVGRYVIDAITTGAEGTQAWTLIGPGNVSTGEVTDGAGKMGGCLATPGAAASAVAVAGQIIYVKAGTYTLSTTTPGAGGPIDTTDDIEITIYGYKTTRGDNCLTGVDRATPIIDAGAQAASVIVTLNGTLSTGNQRIFDLELDGNDTAAVGIWMDGNTYQRAYRCVVHNCTDDGFQNGFAINCISYSNAAQGFDSVQSFGCRAYDNAQGFSGTYMVSCIADHNDTDGIISDAYSTFVNCTVYENGNDGIVLGYGGIAVDCVAVNNVRYDFYKVRQDAVLYHCSGYGAGTAETEATGLNHDWVTITGDPFVDPDNATLASCDFRLNATAGAGAALRGVGYGVFGQTNYRDLGAVQHTPDYPAVGNVTEDDTVNGATGTFAVPAEEDVESGVTYGAGGTEFTGTLAVGGGGRPEIRGSNL